MRAVVGDFSKGLSPLTATENYIFSVDPGTQRIGYSVVARAGEQRIKAVSLGSIEAAGAYFDRMYIISRSLEKVISSDMPPTHLVLETPYVGKNARSAIKLGESRGMVLAIFYRHLGTQIIVSDYTPMQVRRSLGLKVRADKTDVARRVMALVDIRNVRTPDDADSTDALALGYCKAAELGWV